MTSIISKIRKESGYTMKELADLVGVSEGTISRWESGNISNMKQNNIMALAKALNVYPLDIMDFKEDDPPTDSSHSYMLFPCSVSAGALEDIEGTSEYELVSLSDKILGKYSRSTDIILLKVNGDSMNKIIPNRSLIIIDTSKKNVNDIQDGDIVVFSHEGEYSVKRFFNDKDNKRLLFKPESTNELFTAIEFKYENAFNLKLIGKVVKYIVDLD